jgi:hypothetical protein
MLEQLEGAGELPVVAAFAHRALYRTARDADLAQSLQNWNGDTLIAQIESGHRLSEDKPVPAFSTRATPGCQSHGGDDHSGAGLGHVAHLAATMDQRRFTGGNQGVVTGTGMSRRPSSGARRTAPQLWLENIVALRTKAG